MKRYSCLLFGLLLFVPVFLIVSTAASEEEMTYTGLSAKKARFRMKGRTLFLKPGETGSNGVKLISAENKQAVVSIDGKLYSYKKGSSTRNLLPDKLILRRSAGGVFFTRGSINGQPVDFVVDTGATYVSMNSRDARRLKLNYKRGKRIDLSTASKKQRAYLIELDSVRIGGLHSSKVLAAVVDGKFPEVVLLGNSFLHKLNIFQRGNSLIITGK
jgi:aspartyl protease family protein